MDANDKLKRTNQQLKGQISQLRKRLRLAEEELERIRELAETLGQPSPQEIENKEERNKVLNVCHHCGEMLRVFPMGPDGAHTLYICTGCGLKRKK